MVVVPFGMKELRQNVQQFKNESTINCVDLTLKKSTFLWLVPDMNKADLIDAYAQQILDSMDMKTLEQFAYDCLVNNLNDYTEDELITEVSETYPELLEDTEPVYPTEVTELADSNLNTKDGITTPWWQSDRCPQGVDSAPNLTHTT